MGPGEGWPGWDAMIPYLDRRFPAGEVRVGYIDRPLAIEELRERVGEDNRLRVVFAVDFDRLVFSSDDNTMDQEVWAGSPSLFGGCGVELADAIDLLRVALAVREALTA